MCTAAERQYALEVWRLLDHTGVLIPQAQRKARIVNVVGATKKTVLHTLGVLKPPPKDVRRRGAAAALDADDDGGDVNGGFERGGMEALRQGRRLVATVPWHSRLQQAAAGATRGPASICAACHESDLSTCLPAMNAQYVE